MESLENIYRINKERLHSLSIPFREWRHEAILDFDTDLKVAKELGWQGTHSKSLFLKLKGGGYAVFITDKDSRLDANTIKAILGKRPSIGSDELMQELLGCLPGAVCPDRFTTRGCDRGGYQALSSRRVALYTRATRAYLRYCRHSF